MIGDLFQHLKKNNLSPNQYYMLWNSENQTQSLYTFPGFELRQLKTDGFLTENNELTKKTLDFLAVTNRMFSLQKTKKKSKKFELGSEGLVNVTIYREMFPTGKLPSGKQARQDVKELEKKFTWFFTAYPEYTWDMVFEATRRYIEEYAAKEYMGMRCSTFFISKQDLNRNVTSDLATACGNVADEPEVQQETVHFSQQLR